MDTAILSTIAIPVLVSQTADAKGNSCGFLETGIFPGHRPFRLSFLLMIGVLTQFGLL